jgi:hypothetical protein
MKKYKVELTERQLSTLSVATEVIARLGMGQWRDAFDQLPLRPNLNYSDYNDDLDAIGKIISKYTHNNVNGWGSSLGIKHDCTPSISKIAWDLHQTFRHELSWGYAIEEGYVESKDSPRNWSEMTGVNYDEPYRTSEEPLAVIEKAEEGNKEL